MSLFGRQYAFFVIIAVTGRSIGDCKFSKERAICSNLHYIPKIPVDITSLELKDNNLSTITAGSFQNISSNPVQQLILENNSVRKLSIDAFNMLKHIKVLEITNEIHLIANVIRDSLQSLDRTKIKKMVLSRNDWKSIPKDMFKHLTGAHLKTLDLSKNLMYKLNAFPFGVFENLELLECLNCSLVFLDPDGLRKVKNLSLRINNLFEVPGFCGQNNESFAPKLEVLELSDNAIRSITRKSLLCLPKLRTLKLNRNRIRQIDNNVFVHLKYLKEICLGENQALRMVSRFAFNSCTLETLNINRNGFILRSLQFYLPTTLIKLDMERNYIESNTLLKMIFNLENLEMLNLSHTSLEIIPEKLLDRLPSLKYLFMMGNKIVSWSSKTFSNHSALIGIFMKDNQIHSINKTSFQFAKLGSLKMLNLAKNPFWCDCQNKWFVDTIRNSNITKKIKFVGWPNQYKCSYPENMKNTTLNNFRPTVADCSTWNPFFAIVIIIGASVFVIIISVSVLIRCQTNIRNVIYLLRCYKKIKSGYIRIENSENFEFDAFVIYCDADRQWVHHHLVKRLEDEELRICFHHRDFDVGEPITTNIEKFFEKSWKTIVIMSNDFTKSEWCQWEINLAQEKRRSKGHQSLVLIMYRQIDSNHMTSEIRTLLQTTPYLKFQVGFGEKLFWRSVIQDVKRPYSNYPVAML